MPVANIQTAAQELPSSPLGGTFYADPYIQYKSPQNVIGFCQDQKHFVARDPNDLFSYEQCKAAQEKIIKDMNAFYDKASGKQNTVRFKEMGGRAKVQKNSQGITYWEFKTKEGVEQMDAEYNVTKSCPSAGTSFRPASCVLQKQNPCKSSLQGQFMVSDNTGYDPGYPVRREPTWNV
ncbi:hypothetical protein EYZ11_001709 [Aspergillus tanneri]|uniref:Uncharacterized protein n=1 Tax=Aspergillus tanneri TaxID=1220188 RepID=A0A4S3JUA2_9EURO|nr:hypothetical protein EYZ11_001709 [Aspergillus tanneri]